MSGETMGTEKFQSRLTVNRAIELELGKQIRLVTYAVEGGSKGSIRVDRTHFSVLINNAST